MALTCRGVSMRFGKVFLRKEVILGLGIVLLAGCSEDQTRQRRGYRSTGNSNNAGNDAETNPGDNTNDGGTSSNTNPDAGNFGQASITAVDFISFAARVELCKEGDNPWTWNADLGLSRMINKYAPYLALLIEKNDPQGLTGCVAANRNVLSCDELKPCSESEAAAGVEGGGIGNQRDPRDQGGDNSMSSCNGNVTINGDQSTNCEAPTDNSKELNRTCFLDNEGWAVCGYAGSCEQNACIDTVRTDCRRGVAIGLSDCSDLKGNPSCFVNTENKAVCGTEACDADGDACRGTTKVRCENGVLRKRGDCANYDEDNRCLIDNDGEARCGVSACSQKYYCESGSLISCVNGVGQFETACAEDGFSCAEGLDRSGEMSAGCGDSYTDCDNQDCRNGQVVLCNEGAETVVNCSRVDSALTSCELVTSSPGPDDDRSAWCSVPSANRACNGVEGFCDGDVANVCMGGKLVAVDCTKVLNGARCARRGSDVVCLQNQ